jgi:hypothetical protein
MTGAGTLTNDGTINEAGANSLVLENNATLSNAAGATFDLANNGGVSQSGGGDALPAPALARSAFTPCRSPVRVGPSPASLNPIP